jgi:hypothetical protein
LGGSWARPPETGAACGPWHATPPATITAGPDQKNLQHGHRCCHRTLARSARAEVLPHGAGVCRTMAGGNPRRDRRRSKPPGGWPLNAASAPAIRWQQQALGTTRFACFSFPGKYPRSLSTSPVRTGMQISGSTHRSLGTIHAADLVPARRRTGRRRQPLQADSRVRVAPFQRQNVRIGKDTASAVSPDFTLGRRMLPAL